MKILSRLLVPTTLAFALLSANQGHAIPVYASSPSGTSYHYPGGGSVGSRFESLITASVIRLGVYDEGGDGLVGSHAVGLWTAGGTLLASATVPSGTAAPLSGGYRWVTVSASLVAGNEYILGAGYYSDAGGDWFRNTATVNPSFVLKQDLYSDGSGPLSLPTDGYFNNGVNSWYGPNLEAAVPEGGMTAALLGIGMVALGWVRRSSK